MGEAAGQEDGQPHQARGQEHQPDAHKAQQDGQQAKVQPGLLKTLKARGGECTRGLWLMNVQVASG